MSKKTGLEYPKLDNEIITVKNFLAIKSVAKPPMECGDITMLVGEQAAGKSILAKLHYFFWKYQSDLFDEETMFKKTITDHNKNQVSKFFELFVEPNNNPKTFEIKYKSGDIEICLTCPTAGQKIKITVSPFLENLFKKVKNDCKKYSESRRMNYIIKREYERNLEKYEKNPEEYEKKHYEARKKTQANRVLGKEIDKFFANVPDVLYVPASRSFFSTIEDNVFAFLARGREELDPLIVQFGEFYKIAKRRYQRLGTRKTEKSGQRGATVIKNILKGDFIREKEKDIIRSSWGDVELRNASSGQKEALPLILSLLYFPSDFQRNSYSARIYPPSVKRNKNKLLIIEEPEAHLFPTAQRVLVKMIADVVRKENCKVMIATHSPYIPACINNEITIADNEEDSLDVTAYHISDGTVEDIYYKKYDLINVNKLDEASTQIANEYCEQLAKKSKKLKNKEDKKNG